MRPGNGGNLGNSGNVESVSCRPHYPGDGTNPPLSAFPFCVLYRLPENRRERPTIQMDTPVQSSRGPYFFSCGPPLNSSQDHVAAFWQRWEPRKTLEGPNTRDIVPKPPVQLALQN